MRVAEVCLRNTPRVVVDHGRDATRFQDYGVGLESDWSSTEPDK